MELQDDGSYMQVDFVVGKCENCNGPLTDLDLVQDEVKNGVIYTQYECSKCGAITYI